MLEASGVVGRGAEARGCSSNVVEESSGATGSFEGMGGGASVGAAGGGGSSDSGAIPRPRAELVTGRTVGCSEVWYEGALSEGEVAGESSGSGLR